MSTVTATTVATVRVTDTDTTNPLATDVIAPVVGSNSISYGPSVAPTVAKHWSGTVSLAAATQTLDLTALAGPRGSTVNFSSIRVIWIQNNSTVAGQGVGVGNAGANPWRPFWSSSANVETIPAGGRFHKENPDTTPWAVDGTHKNLMLDPGANTFTVSILIVGS